MTNIFDEVGEDLRRDRLKRAWERYGIYLIIVAVLIVAAVAGWRFYESWSQGRAAAAADLYVEALAKAESGDNKGAADALVAFSSDAPVGYAILARFRAAGERALAGETDTALQMFEALAKDNAVPTVLRDLATIRGALIAVDREDLAAVRTRLGTLTADANPWRHSAREIIAMAALKADAFADARAEVDKMLADPETPQATRSRAQIIEGVITSAIGPAASAPEAGS